MKSVLIASIVLFISLFHVPGANAEWIEKKFSFDKMCFGDEMNGMAFGRPFTAWRTKDGGITWESISMPVMQDSTLMVAECIMLSPEKGYIGFNGTGISIFKNPELFLTNNHGDSWESIPLPDLPQHTYYVYPLFFRNGYISLAEYYSSDIGLTCRLGFSLDEGANWNWMASLGESILYDIYNEDTVFLGYNGEIFKTLDRGTSWNKMNMPDMGDYLKPYVYSPEVIWCIAAARLFYSNDGGEIWKEKIIKRKKDTFPYDIQTQKFANCFPMDENRAFVISWDLRDIHFYVVDMSNDTHYALEQWPFIENSGNFDDWHYYNIPAVLIGNRFYVKYPSFRILTDVRKEIDNSVLVENEMPSSFHLNPAYPNPFNPSTTIIFSIPETSYVKLSVYNITGQKIATLADKKMSAGYYSVVWNAYGMSSGTYFFTLESMGKKQTGKMLLLK